MLLKSVILVSCYKQACELILFVSTCSSSCPSSSEFPKLDRSVYAGFYCMKFSGEAKDANLKETKNS